MSAEGVCLDCGEWVIFFGRQRCQRCNQRARRATPDAECPVCGKLGMVWPEVNSCGKCAWRQWRRNAVDRVRECVGCGRVERITGRDLCSACFQRDPQWPFRYAANLANRMPVVPDWFDDYVDHLAERFSPHQSVSHLRSLSVAIRKAGTARPVDLYEGLDPAPAAALEEFLTSTGRGFARDLETGRAAARRQFRTDAIDESIRPHVVAFEAAMLARRDRARRIGTRADTHRTIEARLTVLRDFFTHCAEHDQPQRVELVTRSQVESFLALNDAGTTSATNLTYLRQFFGWARRRRLVLVDPTAGLHRDSKPVFTGPILSLETQQALFRRWTTDPDVHPYEALIGLLCLLHALRRSEIATIRVDDITEGSLALQSRRGDLSLDPVTQTAIDVAVAHQRSLGTHNPHLFVSSFNVASSRPVRGDYITQIVMAGSGQSPRTLRATRLAALVDDLDAISVGNAVGLDPKNALYYLGDSQNPIIPAALE